MRRKRVGEHLDGRMLRLELAGDEMKRCKKKGEISGWMEWKRTVVALEVLGQVQADDWLWPMCKEKQKKKLGPEMQSLDQ